MAVLERRIFPDLMLTELSAQLCSPFTAGKVDKMTDKKSAALP
jgi:hypothetical protein